MFSQGSKQGGMGKVRRRLDRSQHVVAQTFFQADDQCAELRQVVPTREKCLRNLCEILASLEQVGRLLQESAESAQGGIQWRPSKYLRQVVLRRVRIREV